MWQAIYSNWNDQATLWNSRDRGNKYRSPYNQTWRVPQGNFSKLWFTLDWCFNTSLTLQTAKIVFVANTKTIGIIPKWKKTKAKLKINTTIEPRYDSKSSNNSNISVFFGGIIAYTLAYTLTNYSISNCLSNTPSSRSAYKLVSCI